jgi:hypothetical protein
MAETLIVQRGHIGTHKMHIQGGEIPTGIWASIEAQNAGIVAGNWQNHIACSPTTEIREVEKTPYDADYQMLNIWRFYWPRLGSYTRLSFTAYNSFGMDDPSPFRFVVHFKQAEAPYSMIYYGTVTETFGVEQAKRITMEWDLSDTGHGYFNDDVYVQVSGGRGGDAGNGWKMRMNEFVLVTANCPL